MLLLEVGPRVSRAASSTPRQLPPAVAVDQERPVLAGRRVAQPRNVAGVTRGMSTASTDQARARAAARRRR